MGAPTDGWGHARAACESEKATARVERRSPGSRHASGCGRLFLPKPPLPRCIGVRVLVLVFVKICCSSALLMSAIVIVDC